MKIYKQFYILILMFTTNIVYSQIINNYGTPYITNFEPASYNASSQNWAICQDLRGIMYFGNNSGVLEFDGCNWRNIIISNNSTVLSLAIDNKGIIYVGAVDEFGYLYTNILGDTKYFSLTGLLPENEKNFGDIDEIICVDDYVYFYTSKKIFVLGNNEIDIISEVFFSRIFYVNNKLIVVSEKSGICILKNDNFLPLPDSEQMIDDLFSFQVLPYLNNKLFFITNNGCFIYDFEQIKINQEGKIEYVKNDTIPICQKLETEIDDYISKSYIYKSCIYKSELYILATLDNGIIIINQKGEVIRNINKETGIQDNSIFEIFIDKDENLWTANNIGISYIELSSPLTFYNKINNLDEVVLSSIIYNDRLYAGTMNGIYTLSLTEQKFKNNEEFELVTEINNSCWDFIEFDNNLICTGNSGPAIINGTNAYELIKTGRIYCFGKSKKFPNTIFYGTTQGFGSFDLVKNKNGTLSANNLKIYDEIIDPIRKIFSDTLGNLWLTAEYNGLIYINFDTLNKSSYTLLNLNANNGLPTLDYIYTYNIDSNISFTTGKGIYKIKSDKTEFDKSNEIEFEADSKFSPFFTKDSAETLQIYKITKNEFLINIINHICFFYNEDTINTLDTIPFYRITDSYKFFIENKDIYWISSVSNGFFRFDNKIKKVYTSDYKTLIRKVIIAKDSTIFFGNFFNPDINFDDKYPSFTDIQLGNQIPEIDYKFNSIIFEFGSTFYENASSTQFSFLLEGFDNEWSNWTIESKAVYTNIPEGEYTFKVKSKNIYGIENNETTFKFIIRPPWYRTFWTYCFYVIFIISFIILIVYLNIKRLKALNTRLEKIIKDRTIEINKKNIELERQNEEIKVQHEYLAQKNIVLEQKNDEIRFQADKITEYSHELEKLSIVASEIDNAVIIMDKQGDFIWVNKGFTKLFGFNLSNYSEKFGKNIYENSSNPDIKKILENCISSKKPVNYDSFFISDNRTKKWLKTTITPILDSENNISKLIAIDADISDVKEAYKIIETQNQQITGSIRYAQTIQQAILPTKEALNKIGENFIIYKPKDIVSGDFYWLVEIYLKTDEFEKPKIIKSGKLIESNTTNYQIAGFSNSQIYFMAVVDCTGHGVPGAFMSMIANRLLNEIVVEMKIYSPAKILDNLKEKIKKALKQEESGNTDGMDINLCCLKKISETQTELIFSGAKSPLYYYKFENQKIETLKAERITIGGAKYSVGKFFTEQNILLNSGDYIFMFSDGIIDQPNFDRKKFGTTKLLKILEQNVNLTTEQQKLELEKSINEHIQNQEQRDDMTFIGIKIL